MKVTTLNFYFGKIKIWKGLHQITVWFSRTYRTGTNKSTDMNQYSITITKAAGLYEIKDSLQEFKEELKNASNK